MFGFKSKNVDESTRKAAHAGSWYPSSEKKVMKIP